MTVSEIPSHSHDGIRWGYGGRPFTYTGVSGNDDVFDLAGPGIYSSKQGYSSTNHLITESQGGSGAHNHGNTGNASPGTSSSGTGNTGTALGIKNIMNPYIVMYIWRRTA